MARPVTPLLTVDAVIELVDRPGHPVVLIERMHEPHGMALPGGFVDVGETVEQAVIRESQEETGLDIKIRGLLGVYSDPHRDSRGHTVSVVFVAESSGLPRAADDAKAVHIIDVDAVNSVTAVFDHNDILKRYMDYRQGRLVLLPDQ